MIEFEKMENEFFGSDPENEMFHIEFYRIHYNYFEKGLKFKDKDQTKSELWMLVSIGIAMSNNDLKEEALSLFNKTKKFYKIYSKKFRVNIDDDLYYNNMLLYLSTHYLSKRNYYRAYSTLKKVKLFEGEKSEIIKNTWELCVYELRYQLVVILFISGLFLIAAKYLLVITSELYKTEGAILSLSGIFLLIISSIIHVLNKKKQ
ncbi:MAG: hypothetical protein A2W91_00765 [Bacteroidetes bacterium GWF2_38_335]|nr:MAG: hypothetical protein A2W91_00765 [Bacteroidetes bacterium GWF2_38_335]OFY78364.1 MAG: hypothetical protein A2281_04145 [Bacteroidetes bacterium RIFOXYA12_FULL_38_20]HBS87439.1 hypothetical protein [Bacteroidales bacterium]